jgi:xanthine/uracil permease
MAGAPHPRPRRGDEPVWEETAPLIRPAYGIDERPAAWWEALLYGWQHTLVDISPFVLPLAVGAALGMGAAGQARFINDCLLAMGIATLIQTTIGNRLPIIQGPSATLTGVLVPISAQMGGPAMWGGVFVGGLLEATLGASGALGVLRRLFPPAVSGVVVIAIALALGQFAVHLAVGAGTAANFAFAGGVIVVIALVQTLFRHAGRGIVARGAIFFAIWTIGLGVGSLGGAVDWGLVAGKPWLGLPQLFPFGGPGFGWTFVPAAIAGIAVGYLGSIVESLGDYAATCAVSGETYRVRHMNRGIFAEGLGCVVAACLGAIPVTSFTQNIGIIATTGVASRFVVRIAAGVLILYGLCPKFGALLVAMPRSVLGGVFVLVCGMIAMSGVRLLGAARATLADSFVVGTTLIAAVALPFYVKTTLGADWLAGVPPLVALLLTNTVVLAVVLAVGLNLVFNVLLPGDGVRDGRDSR